MKAREGKKTQIRGTCRFERARRVGHPPEPAELRTRSDIAIEEILGFNSRQQILNAQDSTNNRKCRAYMRIITHGEDVSYVLENELECVFDISVDLAFSKKDEMCSCSRLHA